jgi:hypothetical protein
MAKDKEFSWGMFGGKREDFDSDSISTCVREFCEESVGAFLPPDQDYSDLTMKQRLAKSIAYVDKLTRDQIQKTANCSIYIQGGKYRMIIVELPYVSREHLMKMREQNLNSSWEDCISGTEKVDFDWVPAKSFLNHFSTNRKVRELDGKIYNDFGIMCTLSGAYYLLQK